MKIDYRKTFEEGEQTHCTKHLRKDGFGALLHGVVSPELKKVLEETYGKELPYYDHYVCAICGFPAQFYVRFCYYCEREFYGIQNAQQCIPCSKIDWSITTWQT